MAEESFDYLEYEIQSQVERLRNLEMESFLPVSRVLSMLPQYPEDIPVESLIKDVLSQKGSASGEEGIDNVMRLLEEFAKMEIINLHEGDYGLHLGLTSKGVLIQERLPRLR